MKGATLLLFLLINLSGYSQWVPLINDNTPYSTVIAYDSVIISGSSFGGESDLLISTDYGETWTNSNPFIDAVGTFFLTSSDSLIYACTTSGVYRTLKNGFNWENYSEGLTNIPLLKIAIHDSMLFAISYCQYDSLRIFKRNVLDTAWSLVPSGSPIGNVFDLDYDGNVLVLAGYNGIAESYNQGNDWTIWNNYMFEMTSVSIKGDTILAASKGGVYRKIISNGNIMKVSSGLMPIWNPYGYEYYGEFESFHMVGNHVFLCGETGAYKLHDNSWIWQNTDLGGWAYGLADNDINLIAAVGYYGIQARPLDELITIRKESKPKGFSTKVFPNPANDLIYVSSDNEISSIDLYDQCSRLVSSVKPNSYYCTISICDLTSGVYFLKIRSANVVKSDKLIIGK